MTGWRLSGISVWLTALWLLLWGDISAANVVSGVAVAVAVLVFARMPRVRAADDDERPRIRPIATAYLAVYVLTPLDLEWHLDTSMRRLQLQLWPALLLLVFVLVRTPAEATAAPDATTAA